MKRLLFLTGVFLMTACSTQATVGEDFDLKVGELTTVADAGLLIRVDSIGRNFTEAGEIPFVVLSVEVDGEEHMRELTVGEESEMGDHTLEVQSIDPFSDPPECNLLISKN